MATPTKHEVDIELLKNHLDREWGPVSCQMCHKGQWSVGDRVFELREFSGGAMKFGGPIIPVIPITCSNCGRTVLINAIVAGILKKDTEVKSNV
jgi:hypothetical protein